MSAAGLRASHGTLRSHGFLLVALCTLPGEAKQPKGQVSWEAKPPSRDRKPQLLWGLQGWRCFCLV